MRELTLSQYKPRSELRVEGHTVIKPKFPVFDVHTHMGSLLPGPNYESCYDTGEFVNTLEYYGIKASVNLDGSWGGELDRMLNKLKGFEDRITTFAWVDTSNIDNPYFVANTAKELKEAYSKGIRGVKLWKYLSLGHKDSKGRHIPVDDNRLNPIWNTCAQLNIPILIHIADPIAFFKPIDEYNERYHQLVANPDWSFCRPEFFKFEELMEMQENMLYKNPDTTFIIAHFGSASEDLKFTGRCLDSYPNMYIDTAARISELGRQPYTSRDFLIKYQDRVLFGTDFFPTDIPAYDIYYRFFETRDEYFEHSRDEGQLNGKWRIYGVYLPDEVLEKLYWKNAERIVLKK